MAEQKTLSLHSDSLPRIADPRLLLIFRVTWVIFALIALLVTLVSIPAYIKTCNCDPTIVAEWERLGIAQGVRIIFTTLTAVNMTILLGLSALIVWRRPDDRMAMFVSLTSLIQGVFLVAGPAGPPDAWYQAVRLITNFLTPLSWIGLLFLFPNGRFYPSWSRWLLVGVTLGLLGIGLSMPGTSLRGILTGVTVLLAVISLAVGLWSQTRRYRQMQTSIQRQQIKWTLYALGVVALLAAVAFPIQAALKDNITPLAVYVIFRHIITAVAQMMVPASIAVAILRYRLWNVDLAINRTLVFSIVTLGLGILFILVFLLTHRIISMFTHSEEPYIEVAVPAAIIAGLFNPTRKRVRDYIDRRVYGFRFNLNQLAEAQKDPPITNPGFFTGRTLGDYKLLDVVGRGGMGEVYKGKHDTQTVAIKILPQDMAARTDATDRFEREAQSLTTLHHPNIVKFYGYGVNENTPYLVMEYIDGEELGDRIKTQGRLPVEDVCQITDELAAALDYAHEQGIIHRDIKPSNIILEQSGGHLKPVLMDFGVAKIQDGRTSITGSGAIGTIDYMSPEQITTASQVDHRTDIYALGVTLYEMLTGERPFKGSAGQVLFAHLNHPPPDPRDVDPDLPSAIAHAVMKALAKKPEDRFQSASELAAAFSVN